MMMQPQFLGRVAYLPTYEAMQAFTLARVDASPDSEPILRSLGLRRVATTTPYTLPRSSPDSALTPPGPDATSGR